MKLFCCNKIYVTIFALLVKVQIVLCENEITRIICPFKIIILMILIQRRKSPDGAPSISFWQNLDPKAPLGWTSTTIGKPDRSHDGIWSRCFGRNMTIMISWTNLFCRVKACRVKEEQDWGEHVVQVVLKQTLNLQYYGLLNLLALDNRTKRFKE